MQYKITGATPTSNYSADIRAVVDDLFGESLQTLLELCHVASVEGTYGVGVKTNVEIAVLLEVWEPWASMSQATRESTVTTRLATLNGLRT